MLADPIVSKFIARLCRGSNSRRNASAHSSVPAATRIRTNDLLLAITCYSARSIGYLQSLADISASSGIPVKVLGVKRVTGRQNPGAPKCEYVIGPHTPGIHQPAGGPHPPPPDWLKKVKAQRKAVGQH